MVSALSSQSASFAAAAYLYITVGRLIAESQVVQYAYMLHCVFLQYLWLLHGNLA